MRIKEMYDYWYYQQYKFFERTEKDIKWFAKIWPYEERAHLFISFLEILFLSYFPFYFSEVIMRMGDVSDKVVIAVGVCVCVCVCVCNFFLFEANNRWKKIVRKFDAWPKKKNRIGGWIVFGVDMLIFANMGLAIYVLSQSPR